MLPVGADFLDGATSWGVKSSPPIRSFGLGRAAPGKPFYVTAESELRTWAAEVNLDGSLKNFRLFAEEGGEGVTVDSRGNVYIAAGQIQVYDPAGKRIDTIEVPERPVQLVFGGAADKTLFIAARTSLYAVRMRYRGEVSDSPSRGKGDLACQSVEDIHCAKCGELQHRYPNSQAIMGLRCGVACRVLLVWLGCCRFEGAF